MARVQVEAEEEEGETCGEDEQADGVELAEVVVDALGEGAAAGAGLDEPLLARFAFEVEEHEDEGRADDGRDDGEDAKGPSPAETTLGCDAVDAVAVHPGGDEPGGTGVADEEASVL